MLSLKFQVSVLYNSTPTCRSLIGVMINVLTYSNSVNLTKLKSSIVKGARCSSVVRAFAYGAMGCQIDLSWWIH